MPKTSIIELKNVCKAFANIEVIKNLSISLMAESIYCIIGESGSGKTTCMRLMNGLIRPDSGQVLVENEPINYNESAKLRRKMGYALQGSGLFPHMTVFENLSIIAQRSGWKKNDIVVRANEVLEMVSLDPKEFLNKYPMQMSGGQKQRVGIARSLFCHPKIMIMDEPFGALDPITREEVQDLFISLQKKNKLTVVVVTHDLAEAFKMADQVVILNNGRVEQIGSPNEVINAPQSTFVENFLSSHSPSKVLKNISLHSIVDTNYWTYSDQAGSIKLKLLNSDSEESVPNLEAVRLRLKDMGQKYYFEVDRSGQLLAMFDVDSNTNILTQVPALSDEDHILAGIKALMNLDTRLFPVVKKENNKFIGCFNEKIIRSL